MAAKRTNSRKGNTHGSNTHGSKEHGSYQHDSKQRNGHRPRFGSSALATPANAITAARLLASPVLIVLVLAYGPDWLAVIIGVFVFATDGLDGWIARRQGTTSSGAFLDPLADKIVVLGVLYAFVYRGTISWIPVSLILFREVSMSAYRTAVARHGVSIPARPFAKFKTVIQDTAAGLLLIPVMKDHHMALVMVLWIAVALTILSGIQYLYDGIVSTHAS